jgi:hypothetical protein
VLLSLVVAMGTGCADDIPQTPDTRGDSTTTGDTDTTPITLTTDTTGSTTVVADDTATGGTSTTGPGDTSTTTTGDTDTETDTDTGPPATGQSMNQLVTAGERSSSANYTLVYTFGQPSSLQSTHQSTNYTIHGGLIGANGSPP